MADFNTLSDESNPQLSDLTFNVRGSSAGAEKRTTWQAVLGLFRSSGTPQRLSSNLDIYVDPAGSDLNSGLAPDQAFKTLTGAYNYVRSNYIVDGTVTIHLANGTYSDSEVTIKSFEGVGNVVFAGDEFDPSLAVTNAEITLDGPGGLVSFTHMRIAPGTAAITTSNGARAYVEEAQLYASQVLTAKSGSTIFISSAYIDKPSVNNILLAQDGGTITPPEAGGVIILLQDTTIIGSVYAAQRFGSLLLVNFYVDDGGFAATGKQFDLTGNSRLITDGSVLGTVNGTVADVSVAVTGDGITTSGEAGYPEVSTFADLPDVSASSGEIYVVRQTTGVVFINRKPAGFYESDGASWNFLGDLSDPYFNDGATTFSDDVDPSKKWMFQLSTLPTSTTRTNNPPSVDGELAVVSQIPTAVSQLTNDSGFAPLASPSFTGTPTAPTQTSTDNSTKVATTAFVQANVAPLAPLASPGFTGTPTAPTPTAADNSTKLATTAFVQANVASLAPLASPGFTGAPTAPTPTAGDNSTKVATTAFVTTALSGVSGGTKTYALLSAMEAQPPSSNYATLGTINSIPVLQFDDTTQQSLVFTRFLPQGAGVGSGLKVSIVWTHPATTGNVVWGAQIEDTLGAAITGDNFGTAVETTVAVNATANKPIVTTITVTSLGSLAADRPYRVKIYRKAADASDTASGLASFVIGAVEGV